MTEIASAGQPIELSLRTRLPGLATVGLRIKRTPTDTPVPRSTSSIAERPAASGLYYADRVAPSSDDRYLIAWDTGEATPKWALEDLYVTPGGQPPSVAAGGVIRSWARLPGATAPGVQIIDTPGSTVALARTTDGVLADPDIPDLYYWEGTAPPPGEYSITWDTGAGTPAYTSEELVVRGAASIVSAQANEQGERIAVDGFVLLDLNETTKLGVTAYPGLFDMPEPRDRSEERADDDGVVDLTRYYNPRLFALEGWIHGESFADYEYLEDQLRRVFALGDDHAVIVRRASGREAMVFARPVGRLEFSRDDTVGPFSQWRIDLRAADPRLYGTTLRGVTYNPFGTPVEAITEPLLEPLDGAGPGFNIAILTNAGTASSPVTATFRGPWVNPWVENLSTGTGVYTRGVNLAAGEVIVIDTRTKQVLRFDTHRIDLVDWSRSRWLYARSGANTFRAGGQYAAGAEFSIAAYDATI